MAKYFKAKEFKACTPPCDISQMDAGFLALLDRVRERAGIPMVMNSAYRSREWEIAHGRSGEGDHESGEGVDVRCRTSANRYKIVKAALEEGVPRIGIAKTYIHLGQRASLPQGVIWDYYDE